MMVIRCELYLSGVLQVPHPWFRVYAALYLNAVPCRHAARWQLLTRYEFDLPNL
jgi:hypothetical protein